MHAATILCQLYTRLKRHPLVIGLAGLVSATEGGLDIRENLHKASHLPADITLQSIFLYVVGVINLVIAAVGIVKGLHDVLRRRVRTRLMAFGAGLAFAVAVPAPVYFSFMVADHLFILVIYGAVVSGVLVRGTAMFLNLARVGEQPRLPQLPMLAWADAQAGKDEDELNMEKRFQALQENKIRLRQLAETNAYFRVPYCSRPSPLLM